jgi:hypothetical protein
MSKQRDHDGVFDSTASPDENTRGEVPLPLIDSDESAFDPFKSQHMTVSPELRKELSETKLPRLDPQFFHDTLPPNRALGSPVSNAPPVATDTVALKLRRPSRRWSRKTVVLCILIGISVGLGLGLALIPAQSNGTLDAPASTWSGTNGVARSLSTPVVTEPRLPSVPSPDTNRPEETTARVSVVAAQSSIGLPPPGPPPRLAPRAARAPSSIDREPARPRSATADSSGRTPSEDDMDAPLFHR